MLRTTLATIQAIMVSTKELMLHMKMGHTRKVTNDNNDMIRKDNARGEEEIPTYQGFNEDLLLL